MPYLGFALKRLVFLFYWEICNKRWSTKGLALLAAWSSGLACCICVHENRKTIFRGVLSISFLLNQTLPRIKRIPDCFADKGEEGEHGGQRQERANAEPRGLKVVFALCEEFAQRWAAGG